VQSSIYVDTNIIIDICDSKRAAHKESLDVIYRYILRNSAKLSLDEAVEKIYFVHSIFNIVEINEKVSLEALELCIDSNYSDYEDAMQYVCAKKVGADVIVTNDKGFVSTDIKIVYTR